MTRPGRFEAYGWQVIRDVDGHDPVAIRAAIETARADTGRPSLICCKTIIGFGAPNRQGTEKVHGEALGAEEVAAARKKLGWDSRPLKSRRQSVRPGMRVRPVRDSSRNGAISSPPMAASIPSLPPSSRGA